MRRVFPLLCLLSTAAAARTDEDAAHRADRLRTARLNMRALHAARPTASIATDDQRAYDRAVQDYRARMEAWRSRVAACEQGAYDACR